MEKRLADYHFEYKTPEEKERAYREIFYEVAYNSSIDIDQDVYRTYKDLDRTRSGKRQRAALRYEDVFHDHLVKAAGIDDPSFHVEEEWAVYNSLGGKSYDLLERDLHLTTGIAIWFLDHITESEDSLKAFDELSSEIDVDLVQSIKLPGIPTTYEPDAVALVVYLITHRNDDCKGYRRKNPKGCEDYQRVFMDDITIRGAQHQDCPSRNRFDRLVDMIPKKERDRVEDLFKVCGLQLMFAYFRCRRPTWTAEADASARYSRYEKKLQDVQEVMKKNRQAIRNGPAVLNHPNENSSPFSDSEVDLMCASIRQCMQDMDEAAYDTFYYRTNFYLIPLMEKDAVETDFGKGTWDLWKEESFDAYDQYALLAGLLLLCDENDDLVWLYGYCGNLAQYCAMKLPWNGQPYIMEEDPVYGDGEVDPDSKPPVKAADWFDPHYGSDSEDSEGFRFSLAQILYEFTGAIIPTQMNEFLPVAEKMSRYGFKGKELSLLLGLCSVLVQGNTKYNGGIRYFSSSSEDQKDEEQISEISEDQFRSLQKKNRALEDEVHHLARELWRTKERNESLAQTVAENKKELGGLRKAVFDLDPEEEQKEPELDLPYTVQKKTVVYGGHTSWRNVMKESLDGDIRFADSFEKPNSERIRNADVIWLQTNALSHSTYYAIMNEVRRTDMELHYFSYASPKKCIRQLMESEKE